LLSQSEVILELLNDTTRKTDAERIMWQVGAGWPGSPVSESGILQILVGNKAYQGISRIVAGSEFIDV
jgi:hypothetical protein